MVTRDYYFKKYPDTELKYIISRMFELIERAQEVKKPLFTDFLDPFQRRIALEISTGSAVKALSWGGFQEAERSIVGFFAPEIELSEGDFPLSFIKIEDKGWGKGLNHRDYLGALLGTGIKRDKIGDLVVREKTCWAAVHSDVEEYLAVNLDRVGRNRVEVSIVEGSEELPLPRFREVRVTVASARLDAVIGAAFTLSRGSALEYIKGEKVKVNWEPCIRPGTPLKEGDVISVRGKGKFRITEIAGLTRKGRIGMIISMYI